MSERAVSFRKIKKNLSQREQRKQRAQRGPGERMGVCEDVDVGAGTVNGRSSGCKDEKLRSFAPRPGRDAQDDGEKNRPEAGAPREKKNRG